MRPRLYRELTFFNHRDIPQSAWEWGQTSVGLDIHANTSQQSQSAAGINSKRFYQLLQTLHNNSDSKRSELRFNSSSTQKSSHGNETELWTYSFLFPDMGSRNVAVLTISNSNLERILKSRAQLTLSVHTGGKPKTVLQEMNYRQFNNMIQNAPHPNFRGVSKDDRFSHNTWLSIECLLYMPVWRHIACWWVWPNNQRQQQKSN